MRIGAEAVNLNRQTECPACLTPAMRGGRRGRVHSVFARTVNVMFEAGEGKERMLSLFTPGLPWVPDAVRWPETSLPRVEIGVPCRLTENELTLDGRKILLTESDFSGRCGRLRNVPELCELERFCGNNPTGLTLLPKGRMETAMRNLTCGEAVCFIGLGPGLTPSYDDILVGFLAALAALGKKPPFSITEEALQRTTDVSARYLRLAWEGYFGQVLTDLLRILGKRENTEAALRNLARIGATSGRDMARGVLEGIRFGMNTLSVNGSQTG